MLEHKESDHFPEIASVYKKGISLGSLSKSFGLGGLRTSWLATQDLCLIENFSRLKHYLSICNSAPAEILSLIAFRNKQKILCRNLKIVKNNLSLLDVFMEEIKANLNIQNVIALQEEGFILATNNKVNTPLPVYIKDDEYRGDYHIKYGFVEKDPYFIIKIAGGPFFFLLMAQHILLKGLRMN